MSGKLQTLTHLQILSAYMKRLRINYRTAVNGFEALKTFQLNPERFCCVLMGTSSPQILLRNRG
jgi:hypothetical protein